MDEPKERHSKRKASRHDEEGKRKKKHHKEEQDSKSKKKDRHKAIKVVDDDAEDDEMWVEHNIDVDGQHVSCQPWPYEGRFIERVFSQSRRLSRRALVST